MLSERTSRALAGVSIATRKNDVRIKHLFRIMTHYPDLWMRAYANIASNRGAVSEGVDTNTLDGMCRDRIENLMKALKDGSYEPKPARRIYIPKKNGKPRPLGLPSGDDKLVQEVVRILLEQIYEPKFSNASHGFRPERSCHTALQEITQRWKSVKWFVEMDIKGFYDSIDHAKMVEFLERKIDDERFIKIIKLLLRAGYLEDWKFHETYSGTPQGGICSPILANIFLHELDKFMENRIKSFNIGEKRRRNRQFAKLTARKRVLRNRMFQLKKAGAQDWGLASLQEEITRLEIEAQKLPSLDTYDPGYRRLHYVRYADDFLCGVVGSKMDAIQLYSEIAAFIEHELNLQVAKEKSAVRHVKEGVRFLGYYIATDTSIIRLRKAKYGINSDGDAVYGTSRVGRNGLIPKLPAEVVWEFCKRKGYLSGGKPSHKPQRLNLSDYEIVSGFNAEMRGFANYYALSGVYNLRILEWAGTSSLFKTLATKHKTTAAKIRRQMKRGDDHVLTYDLNGVRKYLRVFKAKHRTLPQWQTADTEAKTFRHDANSELLQRMAANVCEYCGKTKGYFEVHHIRKLKDVKKKTSKAPWEIRMCARNRKTLILCQECHDLLHSGKLQGWKKDFYTDSGERSAVKVARSVRRGDHVTANKIGRPDPTLHLDYAKQLIPSIGIGSGQNVHVVLLDTVRVPTLGEEQ